MSAQIALRPVVVADLPHFYRHAGDAAALAMAPPASPVRDWAAFQAHWAGILAGTAPCRTVTCDDAVAGYCSAYEHEGEWSLAYVYGAPFWGRGIARTALELFLAMVPVRPLHARVAAHNVGSCRVLLANGFREVGADRYFSPLQGRDIPELIFRRDAG